MNYGVSLHAAVPQRVEPSEKAELCSQLLAGYLVSIDDENKNWLHAVQKEDGYEGWIDRKLIHPISEEQFLNDTDFQHQIVCSLTATIQRNDGTLQLLPLGARIRKENNELYLHHLPVTLVEGKLCDETKEGSVEELIKTAYQFLHVPYFWGGKTAMGIDCSGFMQVLFKTQNKCLLRDASLQVKQGTIVAFQKEAQPGDLAFFDNAEGKITHVGLVTGSNTILHSSGYVREDRWDAHGIYNLETAQYTHQLRTIRRIF